MKDKENEFGYTDRFINRHIGPRRQDIPEMIKTIGVSSLDELIDKTIPDNIRLKDKLILPEPVTEHEIINELRELSYENKLFRSYIGAGYYGTITPAVIQRNILENPGWYTQYTPYQSEISQGRLEALLVYQSMIIDITGLEISNASLLDEATAAAEAMTMLHNNRKPAKKNCNKFFVSGECFPQTIDVLKTRAFPQGIELVIGDYNNIDFNDDYFALLVQYPDNSGQVNDYKNLITKAHEKGIYVVMAADLLALALLKSPGELGADIAVGSSQRFGVPMGYGGPHAAYFACKDEFRRVIPGRIIGVSVDALGNKAYRMALQTREQHIRREKATSNICTAQVLLAIMAGMYAVYHGPDGIRNIAERVHKMTLLLENELEKLGYKQLNTVYFDTLKIESDEQLILKIKQLSESKEINFRYFDDYSIGISLDETVSLKDLEDIISVFASAAEKKPDSSQTLLCADVNVKYDEAFARNTEYLQNPVFNIYHSETEMMRYLHRLESKDLALNTSMIPLGSCTMKLNAAAEMMPITWCKFAGLHPFAPLEQAKGYHQIFKRLENYLASITGFDAVSLQPNSGAQGEYTGLMVIRAYHHSRGEGHRNIVLIPASAHGTNPASAVMAGLKVVVVKTAETGDIDIEDLKLKAEQNKNNLCGLMVTYPSTHGVFEDCIQEICAVIHQNGGQVYMDGANMNAQIGLTNPCIIGADVCHLNLHKTFSIPHGGGGPGMGPIAVKKHLKEFLPSHPVINIGTENSITAVSAAPWGSASILLISYAYIRMMGAEGLTEASIISILNANYVKSKLEKYYPVLYTGRNGFNAHELIFDMRGFKKSSGIEVEDIAKRLMDYGFHAPTVSFPVPGTFMFEPTESESKEELDRFCDAMVSIKSEIEEIERGEADLHDNLLKNSPHTAQHVSSDKWEHKYSRERAAYPLEWVKERKFWPAVSRIDNAYGDRNFVCSCEPISSYDSN